MTHFRGIIFDMDGTLTVPVLDFGAIRDEIGLHGGDLVTEIGKLTPEQQESAWAVIERHEVEATRKMRLQHGACDLLRRCRREALKLGLVTRNTQRAVDALCALCGIPFDGVVTREFPFLKPHPAPVLHITRQWDMRPDRVLMVGDYRYDIESGRAAGTHTCFFRNEGVVHDDAGADYVVSSMHELANVLRLAR